VTSSWFFLSIFSICPSVVHLEISLIFFLLNYCIIGSVLITKYYSHYQRNNEMVWEHMAHLGHRRRVNRTLVGKPVWKRPLRRFRRRQDDDIKVNL